MKHFARMIPACGWAAWIFWVSSKSKLPSAPWLFDGIDKIIHAAVYGVLALLIFWGLRLRVGLRAWAAVLAAFLYGITDEVHQAFVPGRSPDALDLVADGCGALLAISGWSKWGPSTLRWLGVNDDL